jgi:hypothetical protein
MTDDPDKTAANYARTLAAIEANTKFKPDDIPEIADKVCELIAIGYGLQQALDLSPEFPKAVTFYKWLDFYPDVANKYAHARDRQQHYEADNIIIIADTDPDPNRARVRVDARKWRASKLAPKKYGDRLQTENTTTLEASDTLSALLEAISGKTRTV